MVDLSIVIPAYLEEENLRDLLPRLIDVLKESELAFEILVVDTEKPLDHTKDVCEAHHPFVSYCPRVGGDKYGDAVRTGIANSKGRYVLFMDADGSHSPEFIPKMLQHRSGRDIVVASRYVDGGATENPQSLIWMSRVLNGLYSVLLGIPCRDVSNSFKLYDGELLRTLRLECEHFDIIEEIMVKCMITRGKLAVKEVPFVFKTRKFGTTKRDLLTFVVSFYVTLMRLMVIKSRARKAGGSPP